MHLRCILLYLSWHFLVPFKKYLWSLDSALSSFGRPCTLYSEAAKKLLLVFTLKPLVSFCVLKAYQMRGAGAVIHSHGIETCIASMLDPGAKEFRVNPLVQDSFRLNIYLFVVQKTLFDFADLNADDSYGNA